MQTLVSRKSVALAAVVAGSVMLPLSAGAQTGIPTGAASSLIQPRQKTAPKIAPPPALPGATSRPGTVAPPTQIPADMSPNAALFDAINRGDVAAARDALSRGAELNAHDVLGLTPIELAVDLGRNDIAFLLLSMRGSAGSGDAGPPPAAAQTATAKAPGHAGRPARPSKVVARTVRTVAPAGAPEQPKLFANDGGTPIPSIGFLGFGQRGSP